MTDLQRQLHDALQEMDMIKQTAWNKVVDATNALVAAIEAETESYDGYFPPELERKIDSSALDTAWIYNRIQTSAKVKRSTYKRIRKALGSNG